MIKEVSHYLNNVLRPKLLSSGVNLQFTEETIAVIERQMVSALNVWQNEEFKNTLMLLVSEEAPFYQPDAPLEVKSFVVLTMRNSPFETVQSDAYAKTGLKTMIDDSSVIKFTSEAVNFFKSFDLSTLHDDSTEENLYINLSKEYAVAWNALQKLANSSERICTFPPLSRADADTFSAQFKCSSPQKPSFTTSVKDGFDCTVEPRLAEGLNIAVSPEGYFFSDCFKMVSRNHKLLLSVLEYLLVNNSTFVSTNYLITNGRAEKRKNIIKAAHSEKEMKKHLTNLNGISPEHRKLLLLTRENWK